ncbi:hypothetical protein OAG67_02875 [bacterium]|nr:hypothetical protein [bacterium]
MKYLSLITFISFLYAFNIFSTYPYVSYFFIACGIILTGLILGIKFSKGAYLKLSQSGMEWKTPLSNKIKKAPWKDVESIHIFSIEAGKPRVINDLSRGIETIKQPIVGMAYTEASGRKGSWLIQKINKRFAEGVDQSLPIYYPIEIKDLYLLVYAWKLGFNPTDLELLHNQEAEVRAGILEYEKNL